jgi:hypothetical protein
MAAGKMRNYISYATTLLTVPQYGPHFAFLCVK